MSQKTPRIFARIFETKEYGQLLIRAITTEDDHGGLEVTVDTHPEFLAPTCLTMTFQEGVCEFEKLANVTQEHAERWAEAIFSDTDKLVGDA